MTLFVIAASLLVLASIADVWTTLRGLKVGGAERNPLLYWATNCPSALWAIKLGLVGIGLWLTWPVYETNRVLALAMLLTMTTVFAVIARRNYRLAHALEIHRQAEARVRADLLGDAEFWRSVREEGEWH